MNEVRSLHRGENCGSDLLGATRVPTLRTQGGPKETLEASERRTDRLRVQDSHFRPAHRLGRHDRPRRDGVRIGVGAEPDLCVDESVQARAGIGG